MASSTREEGVQAFLEKFEQTAPERDRIEVFEDFVALSASLLHIERQAAERATLEQKYSQPDYCRLAMLFNQLVKLLDEPYDALGLLSSELGLGKRFAAQQNTLDHLGGQDMLTLPSDRDFITLYDPNCGTGSKVLNFAQMMRSRGYVPSKNMWAHCIDADRTLALMCFVQLRLCNVPAQVYITSTKERWSTPPLLSRMQWNRKLTRHFAVSVDGPQNLSGSADIIYR